MEDNVLRVLRERAGLTQGQLADRAGTSQGQIAKLERGERKLTVDWAVKLARELGAEPIDLLPAVSGEAAPRPPARASVPAAPVLRHQAARALPVRAAARGGVDQEMYLEDGPIDWVGCPDWLVNAPDAYAMYVVGDSMSPRFRPRQLLFVSPRRPPAAGDGVIVVKKSQAVLIKELVGYGSDGVVLREYHPALRDFVVPTVEIDVVHTVTGLREPA
ncbi:helix-turn-helix domain-containing protein [Arenibaculum sp.]|uniref:helix-turn-helix domain-containing protein n=1 Tax=Arenibaculum sp. TaxID=2865862 RepID=UPI002E10CF23|nr:helix-turn-helix domain-containing protein [Arenibaculum sp.]